MTQRVLDLRPPLPDRVHSGEDLRLVDTWVSIAFIVFVQLFYVIGPDTRPAPERREGSRRN